MIRSNKQLYVLGMLGSILILMSYASGPPEGTTGGPDEGFCGNCHMPNQSLNGDVIFDYPSVIEKDSTYDISISLVRGSAGVMRGGFQLVALRPDSMHYSGYNNAGEFTRLDGSSTSVSPEETDAFTRQYLGHAPALSFVGDTLTYVSKWKASFVDLENPTVNFYLAANFANGNNGSSGDRPKNYSFSSTVLPLSKPALRCITTDLKKGLSFEILGNLNEIKSATLENAFDGNRWQALRTLNITSGLQNITLGHSAGLNSDLFRLRLESFEGEVLYSDIVQCKNSSLSISYQSPFTDEIFIENLTFSDQIHVFAMNGQSLPFAKTPMGITVQGSYKGVIILMVNEVSTRLLRM